MTLNTLYFKNKYYRIGRRAKQNTGSSRDSTAKSLEDKLKKSFYKNEYGADALNEILKKQEEYLDAVTEGLDGYSTGLSKTTAFQQQFADALMKGVKSALAFQEIEFETAKTLKITTTEVLKRRVAYANLQKQLNLTNAELDHYMEVNEKAAPLAGKLMAKMAKDGNDQVQKFVKAQIQAQNILQRNTQLSADQQSELVAYSAASGTTLANQVLVWDNISKAVSEGVDKTVAFQEIAEGIAGAGADVRAQFGKIPGNLEMAVLKSKKLGMSLEQLTGVGEGLLDIETSVTKELEYQQLSGKQLVKDGKSLTNAYREATLSGNADKMSDTMNDILETQEDVLAGTNFYAKKALAEALGMDVKQLMAIREKKKATDQLNEVAKKGGTGLQQMVEKIQNMELTPDKMAEIKKQIEIDFAGTDKEAERLTALTALADAYTADSSTISPAEEIKRQLDSIIQSGAIKVIGDKGVDTFVASAKKDANLMGVTAFDKAPLQTFILELNKTADGLKQYGQLQLKQNVVTANNEMMSSLAKSIPLLGAAADKFTNAVNKFVTNHVTGAPAADVKKDAIVRMNDGIIGMNDTKQINDGISMKFHENDKMTIVAGPYGSINDKTADKLVNNETAKMMSANKNADIPSLMQAITNGFGILANNKSSNVDTNSIVRAIQEGLKQVTITVKLDPMAVHKEIEFNIG